MKRLLRGIIGFDDSLSADELLFNLRRLQQSKLPWENPADAKIYDFVERFFVQEVGIPAACLLQSYFERQEDGEVLERLKDIKESEPISGASYNFLVRDLLEQSNSLRVQSLLKRVSEILQQGMVVGEGSKRQQLKGVDDAIAFFQQQVASIIQVDSKVQTHGEVRDNAMIEKEDYIRAKYDLTSAWGALTGIEAIDLACQGIKVGELWIHAAFTGELKTTFALTWAYNLVTRYRKNVLYFSLEMPFKQLRRLICCLHSSHPKWARQGYKPLVYTKVKNGTLSEEEEKFYFMVLDDFYHNPDYARLEVVCPDHDVTIPEIKTEAELIHQRMEINLLVIDHGGNVEAEASKKGKSTTEAQNSVMRSSKNLALHFNKGEGVPVLLLFQINRQGKLAADKNEGVYTLDALSYANEAERSADYVTTTYLNQDYRDNGKTKFCNIKNRDNAPFVPFEAAVDFSCRKIINLSQKEAGDKNQDQINESLANV